MEEYIERTPERIFLRSAHHDKFFADLHKSIQEQIFAGASVLYETVDGERVEVFLPPVDELIRHVTLRAK